MKLTTAERSARWRARNLEYARKHTRDWRARQDPVVLRERRNELRRIWMAKPENRMAHCLGQAKRRASQTGIEFSITVADLLPLPEVCPILGIVLNYGGTGDARGFVNNSPSMDRVDSRKGYIAGNVRVISWRANRLKSDGTVKELQAIIDYMVNHAT